MNIEILPSTITTRRHAFFVLIFFVLLGSITFLALGVSASDGKPLIMPLDDTYIHFQYARQMATGNPYVYNPGQDPTSGATSFLYTPLLAVGYLLGLSGLKLAYWAVALGLVFLTATAWLIFDLIYAEQPQNWLIAVTMMIAFLLGGPFLWASLSGMETSLFMFMAMASLSAYRSQHIRAIWLISFLVTLARPEGAIIGLGLGLSWAWHQRTHWPKAFISITLPAIGILVQPMANWLITGDFSATGNQAKSHLYNITIPLDERGDVIIDQFIRIWREILTGYSANDGFYLLPVVSWLALFYIVWQVRRSWQVKSIEPALLVGAWLVGLSILIATLDTAFWHFKRYQLPMFALLFPLAGWMLITLQQRFTSKTAAYALQTILALIILFTLNTAADYARHYRDNVWVVRHQQIELAEWANTNLPEDATLAVHDVGVMRYVGERTTYDVVGLTTPGTAPAWRQGPGTIYETMRHTQPDYFAIYPDIQGLPILFEAGVYGEELHRVSIELPENTVASATGTQVITRPDWEKLAIGSDTMHQPASLTYAHNFTLLDTLNVADLDSEANANYKWWNNTVEPGFATVVRTLPYYACEVTAPGNCTVTDGGRILNGGERFTLPDLDEDMTEYLVILRVHATAPTHLEVGCDSERQTLAIPQIGGHWVELPILLPTDTAELCLEADGTYEPYYYWIYGGEYVPTITAIGDVVHFSAKDDTGDIILKNIVVTQSEDRVRLDMIWTTQGELTQHGKFFVHLYDDPNQPPVRQTEGWIEGVLPPADWLFGDLSASYQLDLAGLPSGEYSVAIGFYNPNTGERYTTNESDRYFVGEITIAEE